MSSLSTVPRWEAEVQTHLASPSRTQGRVLSQWSLGIVLSQRCGITRVSHWLARLWKCPVGRVRQRLREWTYEASAKRGRKRREVDVEGCFGSLLSWVLEGWEGERELALALDASTLGERFTVLCISVVVRGCAIPVAWDILLAHAQGEWKSRWLHLLELLAGAVPADWRVVVMADRGLYAGWLYEAIGARGWHPLLRVTEGIGLRAQGEEAFTPIGRRVRRRGRGWKGRGEWSEQGEREQGTVLIRWEVGYAERVVVVTDLEPEEAEHAWYQMRFWIEGGFKDQKRGGLGWEHTKMADPARARRLWLAMAVAMQWMVRVGCEEEGRESSARSSPLRKRMSHRRGRPARSFRRERGREQRCLARGHEAITLALMRGEVVPLGHVRAEVWPRQWKAISKPARSWHIKHRNACKRRAERQRQRLRKGALTREQVRERARRRLQEQEEHREEKRRRQAEREQRRGRRERRGAERKREQENGKSNGRPGRAAPGKMRRTRRAGSRNACFASRNRRRNSSAGWVPPSRCAWRWCR